MRSLLLLRHAKSDWSDASRTDHQRPLNQRGISDAAIIAQHLPIIPHRTLCSSAERTRQTAAIVGKQAGIDSSTITLHDHLYMASAQQIMQAVQQVDDRYACLMVVAHNPGVADFVTEYTSFTPARVPTCALFAIEWESQSWGLIDQQPAKKVQFYYPGLYRRQ